MTLITQSEFAQRKNVSRAAVTQWKAEGRLKTVGKLVDLEATEASMVPGSGHRSKRHAPARQAGVNLAAHTVKPQSSLNTTKLTHAPLADYPGSMAALVTGCASDLAVILLRTLPRDRVRAVVEEWLAIARHGAATLLEDDLEPPAGFERWKDHPEFRSDWLASTSWCELEAEAEARAGA